MKEHSPLSPEERRKRQATMRAAFGPEVAAKLRPRLSTWEVVKRIAIGVYSDGFIHAGNLAYISIVALFPFFIVAAAVAHFFGQGQDAMLTVANILRRLPPDVAKTLRVPIQEVLTVRTGPLLWLGALVGNLGAVTASSNRQVDVTSLVTGAGGVDLALVSSNTNDAAYLSREATNANRRPVLLVTVR